MILGIWFKHIQDFAANYRVLDLLLKLLGLI